MTGQLTDPNTRWGLPIARFNVEGDDRVLYRVLQPLDQGPLRSGPMQMVHGVSGWIPNSAEALFVVMDGEEVRFSFRLEVLGRQHVSKLLTRFDVHPTSIHGAELRGIILWVLVELLGLDVSNPMELAVTPQADLHTPRLVDPVQLQRLRVASQRVQTADTDAQARQLVQYLLLEMQDDDLLSAFERNEEEHWDPEWRLYFGGPYILDVSRRRMAGEDYWSVVSPGFPDGPASGSHLVEALEDLGILVADDALDAWIERHLPRGELLFDPGLLEPYELLNAPDPMIWPTRDLRLWAQQMGLV